MDAPVPVDALLFGGTLRGPYASPCCRDRIPEQQVPENDGACSRKC